MKQVLEGGNTTTIAQLYSILTDSHVGLAGKISETNASESSDHIGAAFTYLTRAHEGKGTQRIRRIARTLTRYKQDMQKWKTWMVSWTA